MKALTHSIKVTARLELDAREVELLDNLTAYDNKDLASKIAPNSYQGGVSLEEMTEFLDKLKAAAGHMKVEINRLVSKGIVR